MQNINDFIVYLLSVLVNNLFVDLLIIAICADMLFGTLRAAKYRCWNSAIGIDGAIRKAGMVASVLLFTLMDMLLHVDVLAWLPTDVRKVMDTMGVVKMGITELFALLFILYEATSVLKNMLLCGIPVPAGIREKLAVWLDNMTDETQVDMEYETGAHSEVSLTLDPDQLKMLTLPQLHALAKDMGVEYTDSTTTEELAKLLANEHITAVI